MAMIPDPPVHRISPRHEILAWIEELERLRSDPELAEEEVQEELTAHLNDARTWLAWDLHRRVVEEGEELMGLLREVGALTRRPGDPPPSDARDPGSSPADR